MPYSPYFISRPKIKADLKVVHLVIWMVAACRKWISVTVYRMIEITYPVTEETFGTSYHESSKPWKNF
jgi:hypothetical protein